MCDKLANLNISIGNNFFCNVNHEHDFFLAIYDRISREVDAKLVGIEGYDVAFPPLPGPGNAPGQLRRTDNPKLFDRNEELRSQLLEIPGWKIPKTKRRKTTETPCAIPKAQFPGPAISQVPGPQEPHPPEAKVITTEVKLLIANAESP